MSESDDTDVLLLIPPDFFLVRSDSEDSIFDNTGLIDQRNEIERMVMNNLVSQVNELESRISVIEDKNISNSHQFNLFTSSESDDSRHRSSNHIFNTMSQNTKKLSNSYDNVRNSSLISPLKVQHYNSFPSTPSGSAFHSLQVSEGQSGSSGFITPQNKKGNRQYAMSVQSLTPSEEDFICPPKLKLFSKNLDTPSKISDSSEKRELMNEIDDFIHSTKKQSRNLQEQIYHSQQDVSENMSRFDLKGIDHLLDEMEATEIEIYRKLQLQNLEEADTNCYDKVERTANKQNTIGNTDIITDLRSNTDGYSNSVTTNSEYSSEQRNVRNKIPVAEQRTNVLEHGNVSINDQENIRVPNDNIPGSVSIPNPPPKKRLEFGNEHNFSEDYRMRISSFSRNSSVSNRESSSTSATSKIEKNMHLILPNRRGLANRMSPVKKDGDPSSGSTSSYDSNRSIVTCISNTGATKKYGIKNNPSREQSTDISNLPVTNKQKDDVVPESAVPRGSRHSAMNERISGRAKTSSYSDDNHKSKRIGNNEDSNLVSLVNLWGSEEVLPGATSHNVDKGTHDPAKKLKEEQYRRQHCEQQILQLQAQLLEAQQKLAVAWEVDRAKDKVIFRLQEAWNKLVAHWRDLEEQRHNLTRLLHDERESFRRDMTEASQNVKRYEGELSKMLDLAKGYKEKSETVEKDKEEMSHKHTLELSALKNEIEDREQKLLRAYQDISSLQKEREELLKGIVIANQNIQEEQKINKNAQGELEEVRGVLSSCEAELLSLKEEKSSLQLKIKEERNRIVVLEQQKQSLQISVNEAKKREKGLESELDTYRERIEKLKVELRDYYQKQVEDVVKEKLKEFQDQLDAADASFKNDIESREKAVADLAARQIKEISDKHQLEVRLLEEKHMEKQQLLKLQLNQAAKHIAQLKSEVDYFTSHRNDIVQKLHNMMEAQWQQAMGILSNAGIQLPAQPQLAYVNYGNRQTGVEYSQDGQHYLKGHENVNSPVQAHQHSAADVCPLRKDQRSLSQDSQLTYNVAAATDQTQNLIINHGDKLKEYIEMLLQRTPGSPVTDNPNIPTTENGKTAPFLHWKDIIDTNKSKNQQANSSAFDVSQAASTGSNKDNSRLVKRPWK